MTPRVPALEESSPMEDTTCIIEQLEGLLEEMQCVGYEGKTEVLVCCLCDRVLSTIPSNTTVETQLASRCYAPCTHPTHKLIGQHRCKESALTLDAEREVEIRIRVIFEEMAKKAHQVMAQRRKADYFSITFGCW